VRILLVEDDEMIGLSLSDALRREAMVVDWVRDGNDAAEALAHAEHAIALIDLGLPGKSGFELIETARRVGNKIPVIVLTARDGVNDRVSGLELGADDYLVKPFEVRELFARMRAVLRRHAGVAQSIFEAGALRLDFASHALSYHGATYILSAREFALIASFGPAASIRKVADSAFPSWKRLRSDTASASISITDAIAAACAPASH